MTSYGILEFTEASMASASGGTSSYSAQEWLPEQVGPIWICPIAISVIRPSRHGQGLTHITTDSGDSYLVFADPADVAAQVQAYHQERDAL